MSLNFLGSDPLSGTPKPMNFAHPFLEAEEPELTDSEMMSLFEVSKVSPLGAGVAARAVLARRKDENAEEAGNA